jgi:hypothetical protein
MKLKKKTYFSTDLTVLDDILISSRFRGVTIDGFVLAYGFIGHLNTPPGTKSNYSAIADLNPLKITTAHVKNFPACCVFTSRSLATVSNSGNSSASRLQVLLS